MRAFIYYGLSGGLNTAVTYLLYVGLVQLIHYRVAIPLTYAVGISLAYIVQGRFVFRNYGSIHRFVLAYVVLFLLNLGITWLFVEDFGWRVEIAQVPAVAACFMVGFILSRRFVFRNARGPTALPVTSTAGPEGAPLMDRGPVDRDPGSGPRKRELPGMNSRIEDELVRGLSVVGYDRRFLAASWEWLNDKQVRALTNTPVFSRDDQERWFQSLDSHKDYLVWGVALDGEPIGVFGIKNIACGAGEYWGYIGRKDLWGRGIGRWIVERALERATAAGLGRLLLVVVPTNDRAIRLYLNMGFVRTKCEAGLLHMERVLP